MHSKEEKLRHLVTKQTFLAWGDPRLYLPPSLFAQLCEVERGLQLSGQRIFTSSDRGSSGNSRAHGASVDDLSIAELRDALEQKRKDAGLDAGSLIDTVKNMDGDQRALLAAALADP